MDPWKMYFLLQMGIFHCYVSLPEGTLYFTMDSIGYRWCISASKEITPIQDALALLAHRHRAGSDKKSIISWMYINGLRKEFEDVFR